MVQNKQLTAIGDAKVNGKESIAIIGGGLGGCLTALMLIKQGYHVTLIEKNNSLLSGASRIAARLHRGGEYPKHLPTAMDCLYSAVTWKLLMPSDITTSVPPMRFLVSRLSQVLGERKEARTLSTEIIAAVKRDFKPDPFHEPQRRDLEKTLKEAGLGPYAAEDLTKQFLRERAGKYTRVEDVEQFLTDTIVAKDPKTGALRTSEEVRKILAMKDLKEDEIPTPLTPKEEKSALRVEDSIANYELVRQEYEKIIDYVHKITKWPPEEIEQKLLGSAEKGKFYCVLESHEYSAFGHAVGGFQSQEEGLNPEYLARVQYALEKEQVAGNIDILTGYKVTPDKPRGKHRRKSGIRGQMGDFKIYCEHGDEKAMVRASQIVQAAWSGGPAITPQLGDELEKGRDVLVYRRGMMVVDLPGGWREGPAFMMVGEDGYMIAPYNDKSALVYLLKDGIPYIDEHLLTHKHPELPANWNKMSPEQQEALTQAFFSKARKHCVTVDGKSLLEHATNPRIMVDDTLNFQRVVYKRRNEVTREETDATIGGAFLSMSLQQRMEQRPIQGIHQWKRAPLQETKRGLFTMYPTKLTYAPGAAFNAAQMVLLRSRSPEVQRVLPSSPLPVLIQPTMNDPRLEMEKYSLSDLEKPPEAFMQKFFLEHAPDITPKMMEHSWPGLEQSQTQSWANNESRGFNVQRGWHHSP